MASPGSRLVAWIIDATLLGFMTMPVNASIYGVTSSASLVISSALGFVIAATYLVIADASRSGATLGKRVLQIRVIGQDGGRVALRAAMVRRVTYVVGGLAFGVGWLWCVLDRQGRAWHDFAAKTYVIRASGEEAAQP